MQMTSIQSLLPLNKEDIGMYKAHKAGSSVAYIVAAAPVFVEAENTVASVTIMGIQRGNYVLGDEEN